MTFMVMLSLYFQLAYDLSTHGPVKIGLVFVNA